MKNLHRLLILVLIITALFFETQAAAQKSPSQVASEFYNLILREKPSGLPDPQQMRLFTPYLSQSLRSMFTRARKEQAEYIRLNPGNKPPWIEGCLFSCSFEGLTTFRWSKTRVSGRFAYVDVIQSMEPYDDSKWTDTLILVKETRRWRVWDVRMGCTWPFRMGPTLRKMLSD